MCKNSLQISYTNLHPEKNKNWRNRFIWNTLCQITLWNPLHCIRCYTEDQLLFLDIL